MACTRTARAGLRSSTWTAAYGPLVVNLERVNHVPLTFEPAARDRYLPAGAERVAERGLGR